MQLFLLKICVDYSLHLQYNTILKTSIVPVSLVQPSSKAFKAKIHQTENLSPEESLIRHQEIRKSTDQEGYARPKRCIFRRDKNKSAGGGDPREQIDKGSSFQREGAQTLKTRVPVLVLHLELFQKLSSGGGGLQALFCPVGGGCFVDNVSEGCGGG